MNKSGAPVVALDGAATLEAVGPKAHNLGRLRRGGVAVPDGFVVTVAAWERVLDDGRLREAIARELAPVVAGASLAVLRDASARVRRLIDDVPLPPALEESIRGAYRSLGSGSVAVRSSAAEEDQARRAAAGVFRTVLDVRGEDAVLAALRSCWASLYGEAALAYRLDRGLPPAGGAMAVVVQQMVAADAAGVLFTRSPVREAGHADRDVILVEAVPGKGAALVDGEANPERYELAADEGAKQPVPTDVKRALLGADELSALRRAAARVEELLGPAVDVEWALCAGRLEILQARPITTATPGPRLGTARPRPVRWTAANTQEALQNPVAPLTWSLLAPLVERGRRDLFRAAGFSEIEGPSYMRLFHGRPYFNPEYFRAWLRQIPGAPENIFDALIFGEGKVEVSFRVPEFDKTTFRMIALLAGSRVVARERFTLFLELFGLRVSALAARDLGGASDEALLQVRNRAVALAEAALRRHVLGTAIAGCSYLLLDLLLKKTGVEKVLGDGLTARLTAGARGNVLTQANERLHDLARIASSEDALRRALVEGPPAGVAAKMTELARTGQGKVRAAARSFVEAWRRFLDEHGHRAEDEADLAAPRWVEDSSALVSVLRSYVASPNLEHPRAREERLAAKARELAIEAASLLRKSSTLERFVPVKRGLFWLLFREARRYAPFRENLKAAALRALFVAKRVFLEMGERLVQRGLLEKAGDVFFLELHEADLALAGKADPSVLGALVRERRREHARALATEPPPFILEMPSGELKPLAAAALEEGMLLRGVPVSQGRATGTARVLRSLDEAERVRPGDVVVARVVNAAWTPLFVLAGAIVAEMGGALSHGAIMAREYGVPCVFGVTGALGRIKDGDAVTVDAEKGTVEVVTEPRPFTSEVS